MRRGIEGAEHIFPQGSGGVEEEHAAVEEGMRMLGIGVGGVRNGRWAREGARVRERRVSAVLRSPGVGSPGVVVEVADASVVGGEVGGGGQRSVEGRVGVAEDGYIGVQENNGVVTGERKDTELCPGVLEAGCDERCFVMGWRE